MHLNKGKRAIGQELERGKKLDDGRVSVYMLTVAYMCGRGNGSFIKCVFHGGKPLQIHLCIFLSLPSSPFPFRIPLSLPPSLFLFFSTSLSAPMLYILL